MDRLVVYTANIGGYDQLWPMPEWDGVRAVCFTDRPQQVPGWECLPAEKPFHRAKANSLRYKCLPHKHFPDAEVTIWIDANIGLKVHPGIIAAYAVGLPGADLAALKHPLRRCVYDEGAAVIAEQRADPDLVREQMDALRSQYYPQGFGLAETSVLVRSDRTMDFNEAWWADICRWLSWRDQLSFNPVCLSTDTEWRALPGRNIRDGHPWFNYRFRQGETCAS